MCSNSPASASEVLRFKHTPPTSAAAPCSTETGFQAFRSGSSELLAVLLGQCTLGVEVAEELETSSECFPITYYDCDICDF